MLLNALANHPSRSLCLFRRAGSALGVIGFTALTMVGCAVAPPPSPPPAPPPAKAEVPVKPPVVVKEEPEPIKGPLSMAQTPKEYRKDAANHLYKGNRPQVFTGKMPPLLYAVGVLQVDIDPRGNVRDIRWMRAPKHAPEVMREIEQKVRLAAPFPAPVKMGQVTYTDTWLWHKSGRFQLDTLTEGQL